MTIKTYVINLDNDTVRWEKIKKILDKTDLDYERFPASLGKEITKEEENKYISKYSKYFLTNFIKGCGISHFKIYEEYNKHDSDYILILEDDALLKEEDQNKNLSKLIRKIISKIPEDWDIIRLHAKGYCGYNYTRRIRILTGSNLAYLINKKGIKKMLNKKISKHIDVMITLDKSIKMYDLPEPLFLDGGVDDSHNINKKNISQYKKIITYKAQPYDEPHSILMSIPLYKIPGTDEVTIDSFDILFFILSISIMILVSIAIRSHKKGNKNKIKSNKTNTWMMIT